MEARRTHGGWARRRTAGAVFAAGAAALALGACGGGNERQDADEPEGIYRVEVLKATFPQGQRLAERSTLEIVIRNADRKTIPNITVTLNGLGRREQQEGLADPNRPIFVINGARKQIGGFPEAKELGPEGGETSYVNTWALGPLKPGESKPFRWNVTAVQAVPYRLTYEVAAGLDGKAKAVDETGSRPRGLFIGTISDEAPDSRVADDGKTVIEGTR